MKISKVKQSYDDYKVELSWIELNSIVDGLRGTGGKGVVADELLAGFEWNLERLPKPGEDEDEDEGSEPKGDNLKELPAPPEEAEDDLGTPVLPDDEFEVKKSPGKEEVKADVELPSDDEFELDQELPEAP